MSSSKREITLFTRISYGSGNLLGSGALAISASWLLIFYTDMCGLPVRQATFIYSTATILDVITNPLFGFISDNFNSTKLGRKFGRRRFFIMIGIPLMILYPMIWIHNGIGFWYYFTTYVLFEIVYTMVMIPYDTLPTEMTSSYEERTYLSGLRAMFGKVANFLAAGLPGLFFLLFGENNSAAFFVTGLSYGIIMMIALTLVYFNSWERPVKEAKEESVTIIEGIKKLFIDIFSTVRIRSFRQLLGMYLFGFGAEWLFSSAFTYYVVYVLLLSKEHVSGWNLLSSVLQLVSTAFFMTWVAKKGFKKPFLVAELVVIAAILVYVVIPYLNLNVQATGILVLVTCIVVVFGLGTGGVYYIPWQAYLFIADVDEVVTFRRREGVYSAAMHLAGKFLRAIIVGIFGLCMDWAGFIESTGGRQIKQPEAVSHAIIAVMVVGCIGFSLLGMWCAKQMKINKETDRIVLDEVERIRQGGAMEDVDPHVRELCEELTGINYDVCFGHNTIGYHTAEEKKAYKAYIAEHGETPMSVKKKK